MKITVEHCDLKESEVIIRCSNLDEECLQLLSILNLQKKKITVWENPSEYIFVQPDEVLYFESVSNNTFVYLKDKVYECSLSLIELEAKYEDIGFVRISKSTVLNLNKVQSLKSCVGNRIEVKMKNGEKLIVSRHYAPIIRNKLGL